MSDKFLKLSRNEYTEWLMANHPWAYLLLNLIALRACRSLPNPQGLKIGEALVGDHKSIGATRGQYRHGLKVLERERAIEIIETCRNRKKATTGTTTVGTKVKILDSRVWDINPCNNDHRNNHRTTTEQPPNNHEEEVKEVKERKEKNNNIARSAKRPRKKDALSFDFEKWSFIGISAQDKLDWAKMYPAIDLEVEILRAARWLKDNPSKNNRTLWGRYLHGWLKRNNEWAENKKAFRSSTSSTSTDRRTKDINGNPIKTRAEDAF